MTWRQRWHNLIVTTNRWAQVDVAFYTHSLPWASVNYASNIARGVATTFFLARTLPIITFGEIRYLFALFGVAGVFGFSSLHTSIIRAVAAGDTVVIPIAQRRMMLFSCLGSLILLIAAILSWRSGDVSVSMALVAAAIIFPFSTSASTYGSILTGLGDLNRLSRVNTLVNLGFLMCFLAVLSFRPQDTFIIVSAFFLFDILTKYIATWLISSEVAMRGSLNNHLSLGNHLSFMSVMQALAHQADQLIVKHFFGYVSLAEYNVAILIPEQIIDFTKGFTGIMLQRKTQAGVQVKLKAVQHQFRVMLVGAAMTWALYAAAAPMILPWLFPQYASQVMPTIIYALGIFGTASAIGLTWMQATDRVRLLWRFTIFNTVSQLVCSIGLLWLIGPLGAILAKTIVRVGNLPLTYPREEK